MSLFLSNLTASARSVLLQLSPNLVRGFNVCSKTFTFKLFSKNDSNSMMFHLELLSLPSAVPTTVPGESVVLFDLIKMGSLSNQSITVLEFVYLFHLRIPIFYVSTNIESFSFICIYQRLKTMN